MKEAKKLNILNKYKKSLSLESQKAINSISKLVSKKNINAYLIGGIVRDIILGKKGFDIDITLETEAIEFAKDLESEYENCILKETHQDFKTAKVLFEIENKKIEIDLASTRKEEYKTPASLPEIKKHACPIIEDVIRRDFTINTMGISLNEKTFGDLVDCLEGLKDLEKKELKIIHDSSFVDDPTRILRMLKFSIRFGFNYEEKTKALMNKVLHSGQFDNLGSERIKLELKQTLNLNKKEGFDRIINENIYKLINIDMKPFLKGIEIQSTINQFEINQENIWLIYLACMLCNLKEKSIEETSQNLHLNNFEKKVLQDTKELFENKKKLISNYEIYKLFKGKEKEAVVCFGVQNNKIAKKYLEELQFIKVETTGDDLIQKGFEQGKNIGITLEKLLKAKLNGEIQTKEDEQEFLVVLLKLS